MPMTRFLVVAGSVLALAVAGCGGDDGDSDSGAAAASTATQPPPPNTPGTTVKLAADKSGQLAYQQKTLTAPAGTVVIEFDNPAQVPHDVKVEKDGMELGGTDVVSKATANATLQLEAGEYTFYCSVGSHRGAGMEGTLTVE